MMHPILSQKNPEAENSSRKSSFQYLDFTTTRIANDMGKTSLLGMKGDEDSWQFTYMDVITLLFATFVLLLALYGNQVSKQQEVLEGMTDGSALQLWKTIRPSIDTVDQTGNPAPTIIEKTPNAAPTTANPKSSERLAAPAPSSAEQSALDDISKRVAEGGLGDMVAVEARKGELIITMKETLLFPSGQASLSEQGAAWIRGIVPIMQSHAALISVEGHTDNVPIKTEKFPSNWELSAGRASSVVREFVAAGIPSDKLRAIGYGDSRPIGLNAFPSGREQNRRVQIKLNYAETEEDTN